MTKTTPVLASASARAIAFATHADLDRLMPEARGKSVFSLRASSDDTVELMLYGPIGDYFWDVISSREIVEQIAGVTASTINVRINSDGGVVNDGLAIYNALKRHGATVNITVDGIAASIASLIAMAGDRVEMYANTMLMVHAPHSGVWGNAAAMRRQAEVLDTWAKAMRESYTARTGKAAEVDALLTDGLDHYFTATEAVEFGFVDAIADAEPETPAEDAAAAAALMAYVSAISNTDASVTATLRTRIQATCRPSAFASLAEAHQRAILAHIEDPQMSQQCQLIMANAGGTPPAAPAAPVASVTSAAPVAAGAPAAAPVPTAPDPIAALTARNTAIRGVFAQFRDIPNVRDLEADCLADPAMTVEQAQAKLLARIGSGASPLADPATAPSVQAGMDEADKLRERGVQMLMARAGMLRGDEDREARQGNPFAGASLIAMAERSLARAGVNTRSMDREEIARRALAVQTTSDFPVLLENTLHKMVLSGYRLTPFTWQRFCAVGSLSDYRPHNRYHLSSFSDLKPVNEAGEYETGVLGDGEKESIKGARKGRILQITPEVLVNDDVGAFARIAAALGQAAGRTIEKDVYALFAMNGGAGPTMSDGKALFHADHKNIASSGGAPSVSTFDAARQQMGSQMDPGGNDYLDILPAIWLGPLSLRGVAVQTNEAEYDDETSKNQRRPNISRGLVRDIVDTPRLSGKPWYLLADPSIEPVFEVAFLNGVQTPTLEQETNFRTDGLSWKVVHKYGVGAVGWRGAVKNAGE